MRTPGQANACGVLFCAIAMVVARGASAGDFNGDGYDDIAISAPYEHVGTIPDAGSVTVIYGSPTGLVASVNQGAVLRAQLWHQDRPGILETAEPDEYFGEALAAGDFNDDGFDDLAIGVQREDLSGFNQVGLVHILNGSPNGLRSTGNYLLDTTMWGGVHETTDLFGPPLVAGDYNGDGVDDLAIGVSGDFTTVDGAGTVHMAYGVPGSGLTPGEVLTQDSFGDPGEFGDRFGVGLAAGDINLDGFTDLVISASFEDYDFGGGPLADVGMVHVALGSPFGMGPSPSTPFILQSMLPTADTSEAGDQFGYSSLACGDINGDEADDLIAGVPFEDTSAVDAGAINYIPGIPGGDGLDLSLAQWIAQETFGQDVSEVNDGYGLEVAVADVYPNGFADILICAYWEGPGAAPAGSGEVNIIRNGGGGLSSGGAPAGWSQNSAGVLDLCEAGDVFGADLAIGDFNGDGFLDIAFGVAGEDVNSSSGTIMDAGMINVLYGTPTGPSAAADQIWHQNRPGVPDAIEAGDWFGSWVR